MEGVLVGEDINGCAFVYGSLSFADKIACGLALYMLESYQGNKCYYLVTGAPMYVKIDLAWAFGWQELPRLNRI
jgi:hypothetical protein